jgi:hypothetical protein
MKRVVAVIAIALVVGACGEYTFTATPVAASPSATPTRIPIVTTSPTRVPAPTAALGATPIPAATADISIVTPRMPGMTIKPGDSGEANLDQGDYRIAWYAPGCASLSIEWQPGNSGSTRIVPRLPSGDIVVALPAGVGFLKRTANCQSDYIIRFERVPGAKNTADLGYRHGAQPYPLRTR